MKNLKLELFNFKKELDQEEILVIVEGHMSECNQYSENYN
jgi:hypothetical protein